MYINTHTHVHICISRFHLRATRCNAYGFLSATYAKIDDENEERREREGTRERSKMKSSVSNHRLIEISDFKRKEKKCYN